MLAAQVIRLNLNKSTPECVVCVKKKSPTEDPVLATLKCWECDKFLCNKCVDVHKNLLKFHTLIRISHAGQVKVSRKVGSTVLVVVIVEALALVVVVVVVVVAVVVVITKSVVVLN